VGKGAHCEGGVSQVGVVCRSGLRREGEDEVHGLNSEWRWEVVQSADGCYGAVCAILFVCADVISCTDADEGTSGNEPVGGMLDVEDVRCCMSG
jgi:hypothetical protein